MSTFITRLEGTGPGLRLAVKDLIDMEGQVTTAGCRAVAERAEPAARDAACLAGARQAEADGRVRFVGKVNLHELATGATGINPWYGTPVNPLDPELVPGGSSSGSAVVVGSGEAEVSYGSDTAGSVRIPAACCGVVGLKTTWGRVPLDGVYPLSGELDTIGPMARDVDGVVQGMALLEPGFAPAARPASVVGRVRVPGVEPSIDAAVDDALERAGLAVEEIELAGWDDAVVACLMLLCLGAWENNRHLLEAFPDQIGDAAAVIRIGAGVDPAAAAGHRSTRQRWQKELAEAFRRVEVLATPTLKVLPPRLDEGGNFAGGINTPPVNLAGVPALALPVPRGIPGVPASLQLIGPMGGEELLVATGRQVEAASA